MRHERIDTTMRFYFGQNAEATADELWQAMTGRQRARPRRSPGNSCDNTRAILSGQRRDRTADTWIFSPTLTLS